MTWLTPQYSRSQVDAAGGRLIDERVTVEEFFHELDILNNWRGAHSFPLNTFQVSLRQRAQRVYESAVVAQRLKRVPSIIAKMRRFESMKLSRMQDIGGCRAVVGNSKSSPPAS